MDIYHILNMLGGLALFLFGMHTLSGGLEKFAGGNLERWLEKLTSNPIKGVALGVGVTALIQSSAATTVMMVGFVNSGIMKLSQAIGVIMGANIGTTATSWLLSLSAVEGEGLVYTDSGGYRHCNADVHEIGQEKNAGCYTVGLRNAYVRHERHVRGSKAA